MAVRGLRPCGPSVLNHPDRDPDHDRDPDPDRDHDRDHDHDPDRDPDPDRDRLEPTLKIAAFITFDLLVMCAATGRN